MLDLFSSCRSSAFVALKKEGQLETPGQFRPMGGETQKSPQQNGGGKESNPIRITLQQGTPYIHTLLVECPCSGMVSQVIFATSKHHHGYGGSWHGVTHSSSLLARVCQSVSQSVHHHGPYPSTHSRKIDM